MNKKSRYFLWNKSSDFGTGHMENIRYDDNGLYLEDEIKGGGFYFSRMLDSDESGKKWRLAELKGVWYSNSSITVTFFASDKIDIVYNKQVYSIEKILSDKNLSFSDKMLIFSECSQQKFCNRKDIMLTDVKGRYLWFCIQIQSSNEKAPYVKQLKLWLDEFNWLEYLPEIYGENLAGADFTIRFLSIFQNLYEEMNDKIKKIPVCYDIYSAERPFMEWLAEWVGLEHSEIWNDSKLRELLKRGHDLYRRIGTPGMISDISELYTGVKPILLENYLASDTEDAIRAWKNQNYSREPFGFTVIFPVNAVNSEEEHKALRQILLQYKPVHMRMKLIFAEPEWLCDNIPDCSDNICLDGRASLRQRR